MVKIAAVFALSGVGKTWQISRYATAHSVLHVEASQLLREAKGSITGAAVTSEELRTGAALDNQQLLIRAFATFRANATAPIIFDGHCLIDAGRALIEITAEVIEALAVSSIVFIKSDPQSIVERRRSDMARIRPLRSAEEIFYHQQRAQAVCQQYAELLKLDLHMVEAGDEEAFSAAIASIFETPAL